MAAHAKASHAATTWRAMPLRTPLLRPGDDILAVAEEALRSAGLVTRPTDIVAICESPLAITQGRVVDVDDIRPGAAARTFCRLFSTEGSLGDPYGMQLAIDEVGLARIALALVAGIAGRLLGHRGDFYRLAGRPVAWIDAIGGTMGPYSQCLVLGPRQPGEVVGRVGEALACRAAVVDVNDLGKVEVLAASPDVDVAALVEVLRSNPQGNDDEQTPLVLVRRG